MGICSDWRWCRSHRCFSRFIRHSIRAKCQRHQVQKAQRQLNANWKTNHAFVTKKIIFCKSKLEKFVFLFSWICIFSFWMVSHLNWIRRKSKSITYFHGIYLTISTSNNHIFQENYQFLHFNKNSGQRISSQSFFTSTQFRCTATKTKCATEKNKQ